MTTHPILFSTPMVQAILEGRKTMTRRIVKFKPFNEKKHSRPNSVPFFDHSTNSVSLFPYGKIGDILWVRETVTILEPEHCEGMSKRFYYKANHHEMDEDWRLECISDGYSYKWIPSIFMPKAAARIFLKITNIRVERLQDIDESDAKDEGMISSCINNYCDHFMEVWETINGKKSWDENPWVWVISFERCEKPENF